VARGEGLEEALVRELREELGAAGEVVGPPLALLETISPDAGRERHTVHIVFPALLSESTGTTATVDPAVKELRWFRTDELGPLDVRPPIQGLLASWSTLDLSRHRDDWPPLVHQRCPWTPEP
jgi:8-oxo-dGTP pyrophosphatase MutT (NUDIX family)